MKKLIGVMLFWALASTTLSQTVVGQEKVLSVESVKYPAEGTVYYDYTKKSLFYYDGIGFKSVSGSGTTVVTPPVVLPPTLPPTGSMPEVVIGTWKVVPNSVLITKEVSGKLFLLQTDASRSYYVFRGSNMLDRPDVVITGSVNKNLLSSDITGNGGLNPGALGDFPKFLDTGAWVAAGYSKNSNGEWVKGGSGWIDPGNIKGKLRPGWVSEDFKFAGNLIETSPNRISWERFSPLRLPEGFYSVLGYGFPTWKDEPLLNGRLRFLEVGHTHAINLDQHEPSKWVRVDEDGNKHGDSYYYFQSVYHLVGHAVKGIVESGGWDPGLGDPTGIAKGDGGIGFDFQNINKYGAMEIGKRWPMAAAYRGASTKLSLTFDINADRGWIMLDEEIGEGSYNKGNPYGMEFYGNIAKGLYEVRPETKQAWYGTPLTWAVSDGKFKKWNDAQIENDLLNSYMTYNQEGFKDAKIYIDCSLWGYFRVPWLKNGKKYERDNNGNIKIENGKRVWIKADFVEPHFGHNNVILAEPAERLVYQFRNEAGQNFVGKFFYDQYLSGKLLLGYNAMLTQKDYWKPETELFVEGVYNYADGVMLGLMKTNKVEFGDFDISKFKEDAKMLTYTERRPRTEPWTAGGNSDLIREIGEDALRLETYFGYLSGIRAVSSWDNGNYLNGLKPMGEAVYGQEEFDPNCKDGTLCDDNYTRYNIKTDALQRVWQPLAGYEPADFKFVHFWLPGKSRQNNEVISSGIYVDNKLVIVFCNPSLDPDEKQDVKLIAGNDKFNLQLIGTGVQLLTLEVPVGLATEDFKLEYSNIYGKDLRIKGKVSGKVAERYY